MTAKNTPRHARTLPRPRRVPRPGEGRLPGQAPGRAEPGLAEGGALTRSPGPVAVTGRAVLGDRIRRPTAWCELPCCISRYDDPAALGEADIRARALAAGWRHDAAGRLVCPYCQQRNPHLWAAYPVVPQGHTPAGGPPGADRARAGRLTAVWATLSAWSRGLAGDLGGPRWPHRLAVLAGGGNGWNTPPARPAPSTPGRRRGAGAASPGRPAGHRAAAPSPGKRRGPDHRHQQGHGGERAGAWLGRRVPSTPGAVSHRHRR
jgi:hypothetical protein